MYILADIVYWVVYYIVGYRRRLVRRNIEASFPEMTGSERKRVEHRFYRHLCDLFVEGVYNMYASPSSIKKRYKIVNRQVVDRYYEQGKSVVLMAAHYNNWEYMVTSLNMQLLHHGIGVGKPLNNSRLEDYLFKKRTRYGTQVVYAKDVRQEVAYYDRYHVPCALMMLSDQSPSNPYRSYWTTFFHQDTAFLYGAEYFARKYNYPVLYYSVKKVKRGRYEIWFSPLTDRPCDEPQYSIVERYVRLIEKEICDAPEFWLWSHRRWKLTRNGRIMKDGSIKILKR